MDQADIANMIDWVAQGIAGAATGEPAAWLTFTEAERDDFRKIATASMAAHDAWLTMQGYRIVPPGMIAPPAGRDEAAAMVKVGCDYLEKNNAKSAIIVPPRPSLQRVN